MCESAHLWYGPMQSYKLNIAYDGRRFHGWQVQPDLRTVQGLIEAQLSKICQSHTRLRVTGRTDAGVSARDQVAVVSFIYSRGPRELKKRLNALLGPEVFVKSIVPVSSDFDPRRNNLGKRYCYHIANKRIIETDRDLRCLHIYNPLDLRSMNAAAAQLVGTHDFASFQAADCDCPTSIRTVFRASFSVDSRSNILFTIEGTAFLKNMVRIIVGTLVDIGRGKIPAGNFGEIIRAKDRENAGITAPAEGLFLDRVFF